MFRRLKNKRIYNLTTILQRKNAHAWRYRGQILELWLEKGDLFFEDSSQGHPASYHQADKIISKNPEIA